LILIRTKAAHREQRSAVLMKTIGTLLFTLILSGFSVPRCEATVYYSNGSVASVQALHNAAHDGDIIVLPAGIFSWTSRLNITRGITIQGATVISGPASNPTINNGTIIKDDTPRSGSGAGIITAALSPSQSFRLTGITFAPGNTTTYGGGNGAIHLHSSGASPNTSIRVDHCHFDHLYQGKLIWVSGWVYGVADHNVMDCRFTFSFYIQHHSYGGTGQTNGNGSWADYPWYGTNKFFFVEDNRVNGSGLNPLSGTVDSDQGARAVFRHNYFNNSNINSHGTEGGTIRGMRAYEVYDNVFHWSFQASGGGQRSGGSLWHDNLNTGVEYAFPNHTGLNQLREYGGVTARTAFGPAAVSPWDMNDTEGNGTYVEGHAPFLFDSGTDTSSVNSQGVIHDSTKNWTPNQWVGYSIRNMNPSAPCYLKSSIIKSNTANTITYVYYPDTDRGPTIVFNSGDAYDIHRVLTALDQPGRGKGDQVAGSPPINTVTGTPQWPHQISEPCMSWNNIHSPSGHVYGFGNSGAKTSLPGRDFFNLGAGFPANTTPSAVSSHYTAAVNGVDYTGTFLYPHPLVTGQPTSSPTPTATRMPRSQQHLQKNKNEARKLKRRKKAHEN
jgi:hypothetical protein